MRIGILSGLLMLIGLLNAQVIDRIEGVVDNEIILLSDIQNQIELLKTQGDEDENIHCRILDNMLTSKLLVAQAIKDSVEVSSDEVENELNRKINYYIGLIGSKEKFEAYYEKSIDQIKNDFRKDIRDQLLSGRMRDRIISDVEVTPGEVRSFFAEIPEDSLPFFNKEIELSQVVISAKVGEDQQQATLDKVKELKTRIDNGESFELLASLYSEDPGSASQGGELGFVERGQLVPAFEVAAFALEKEEVSEIVKSVYGYHIIKLIERRGEMVNARHILVIAKPTSADIIAAKSKIDSIRTEIVQGTLNFNNAVNLFSEDEYSKNTGGSLINPQTGSTILEADQIEPTLFFIVDTMSIGKVSESMIYQGQDGTNGYRIVRLDSKTDAHIANLQDDYDKLYNAAKNQKQSEILQEWIRKKARKTYIRVEDEYLTCQYINEWLK